MSPSPPWSERFDSIALITTLTWWLRAAVLVGTVVAVLLASGSHTASGVELAVGIAGAGAWWVSERLTGRLANRARLAGLLALTVSGGVAGGSGHNSTILTFACMSTLGAGAELVPGEVAAVVLAAVLADEVAAIVYGKTTLGTMLGYPALYAALALLGRYRRVYRLQAESARALLAETQRAQDEAERAAALTERSRIAREIHDVLAHSLGALGIQLQAAEAMLTERGDIDSALGALGRARRLVDEGLAETRRAVHALRTDAPPLPEALAALLDGSPGRLEVSGEPYALGPAAGLALLRVAQEAVVNARKHAGTNPAAIALRYGTEAVELRVENMLGPESNSASADASGGYGLAGMHERLRLIGGDLTAGRDGERWIVRATVTR